MPYVKLKSFLYIIYVIPKGAVYVGNSTFSSKSSFSVVSIQDEKGTEN